jgi:hypothetical protein
MVRRVLFRRNSGANMDRIGVQGRAGCTRRTSPLLRRRTYILIAGLVRGNGGIFVAFNPVVSFATCCVDRHFLRSGLAAGRRGGVPD